MFGSEGVEGFGGGGPGPGFDPFEIFQSAFGFQFFFSFYFN